MSNLFFPLSLLLGWMAAAVFASRCTRGWRDAGLLALGYAVGLGVVVAGWAFDAVAIGVAVIGMVAVHFLWPRLGALILVAGGLLAAGVSGLLRDQGVPLMLGATGAALVVVAAARLARQGSMFVSADLQDEAMLFLLVLALVTASLPSISAGWHSAAALNVLPATSDAALHWTAMPWVFMLCGVALTAGAGYSIWKRRRSC